MFKPGRVLPGLPFFLLWLSLLVVLSSLAPLQPGPPPNAETLVPMAVALVLTVLATRRDWSQRRLTAFPLAVLGVWGLFLVSPAWPWWRATTTTEHLPFVASALVLLLVSAAAGYLLVYVIGPRLAPLLAR